MSVQSGTDIRLPRSGGGGGGGRDGSTQVMNTCVRVQRSSGCGREQSGDESIVLLRALMSFTCFFSDVIVLVGDLMKSLWKHFL